MGDQNWPNLFKFSVFPPIKKKKKNSNFWFKFFLKPKLIGSSDNYTEPNQEIYIAIVKTYSKHTLS